MPAQDEHGLEVAMGRMLQIGVTIAALVVLFGGVLYLKLSPSPRFDYQRFHGSPTSNENIHMLLSGVSHFDSQSLIVVGILLLIATPICRVIFGVVGFTLLRDRLYAIVSTVVLLILLFSLFPGR